MRTKDGQYKLIAARALIGENVRQVNEREFPYVVPLVLTATENPISHVVRFCTGTLISNRDVLTAEHCLVQLELHRIRIMVGSDDIRNGRRFYIYWTITYKEWALYKDVEVEFKKNDIAIIRLSANVSDDIRPIPLSSVSNTDLYGVNAMMAGWGQSNNGNVPMVMETTTVTILPNDECQRRALMVEGRDLAFHSRLLCTAAEPYAFLSYGDSGGPLLYNDTIIGVSSGTCLRRDEEFHPEKMNLHFGIQYYKTFILDVINNFNN